jgi:penicillin amidase
MVEHHSSANGRFLREDSAVKASDKDLLSRLGAGESIESVCAAAGLSRQEFNSWWQTECRRRVPPNQESQRVAGLQGRVSIGRDRWGIPHVQADSDADLFFGFGYATAQDRLFQLDFLRRKAYGRLAEILGPAGFELDLLARTIGLGRIAAAEWRTLPTETQDLLTAYTAGVNALIESSRAAWPIEFDLLDYQPEPWSPIDCLAIIGDFRWYLTGRFPVLVIPELVKRALGDGPLYRAFLQGEADQECILPSGSYPAIRRFPGPAGATISEPEGHGSNNWVLAPARTTSGKPVLASDPHVPFGAVSIWHEIHLHGGSFHVTGVALAGMPAVMIGRNPHLAWGVTNNICSQRELYLEKTDPDHPDCFLFDGQWEPASQHRETISIKGAASVQKTIRSSRNGPIVDEVLPPAARGIGPVALRWLGAEPCGWLTALLNLNRAQTIAEFRVAARPWCVPTFNLVFADKNGDIGHQCVGRIPLRRLPERGFRPGWDPLHQWAGVIPFEDMPHLINPKQGFVVTANNRLARDDFPYPLSGTWSSGHRARRIRQQLESRPRWSAEDCRHLQQDVRSGRAVEWLPALLALLTEDADARVRQAVEVLRAWDCQVETESVAAALFNVFFVHWCRTVTAQRLPREIAEFATANAGGLAAALLVEDSIGWFSKGDRGPAVRTAFRAALEELAVRLGPDLKGWTWGRLHTLVQKHFLSGRGDLGLLLDRSGMPVRGDVTTVCSSTPDAGYAASLGASYRMVADLADPRHGLWAVDVAGVSGHPGSPHYDDQLATWGKGGYHYLALDDAEAAQDRPTLTLEPAR